MSLDPALESVLYETLDQAVEYAGAVAGVVYLLDADCGQLAAAMIVGLPPAVFSCVERLDLDAPGVSPTAWRTGRTAVVGEPATGEIIGLSRDWLTLPYPCSVTAFPIHYTGPQGERRGGALCLVRVPGRDGPLHESHFADLRQFAERLAGRLAELQNQGVPVQPAIRVTIVPRIDGSKPTSGWGAQIADSHVLSAGSSALTMMDVVHRCYPELGHARAISEVIDVVRHRVMKPFGAQALILTIVSDSRQWVVGHAGVPSGTVRRLHGAAAEGGTPSADVVNDAMPRFWTHVEYLRAAYPGLREPTPFDGCEAWAFVPLVASSRVVGTLCLGWGRTHEVTADEQGLLAMLGPLLGAAVDRARLGEAEHALAQSLQRRLLPGALPNLAELSTAARYLPASPSAARAAVGGDWYDAMLSPDGRIWLVVGDVEGHAWEAAGVMGQLRAAVRAYAAEGHNPAAALHRASTFLAEESSLLATCCLARFDPTDGALEIALAGHPAPLIRHPDGTTGALSALPGLPLGVDSGAGTYDNYETGIVPGAILVFYTDGLCTPRSEDVQDEALRLLQAGSQGMGPGDDLEQLADRLMAEAQGADRPDDTALLVARYDAARGAPQRHTEQMHIERHDLRGVAEAREFVHETLAQWQCDTIIEDAELGTSEIVTNALLHADSVVDLRLRQFPDRIRIEVRDTAVAPPVPSSLAIADDEEAEQAEGGRGLMIVEHLAQRWGSSPSGRGKNVWFELSLEPEEMGPIAIEYASL
ncbi:SpoIIE family protein phosphatase [Streptomyces spiralis]